MNFKDYAAADLNVFINANEFADDHIINGEAVRCVVDDDINQARTGNTPADGVFVGLVSVFVKTADFNYRPVQGEYITLDDAGYYVVSSAESMGILEIKLKANLS